MLRSKVTTRRVLGVVALAAMSAAGAGCGSSTPAGALFPKAYAATVGAKSAKVTLTVAVTTAQGSLAVKGSGVFDWAARLGQLTEHTTVGGQTVTTDEVLDGTDIYVQIPAPERAQIGGKAWLKVSAAALEGQQGNSDPSQILALLNGDASSVKKVGSEKIAGVATTHYSAQVDPAKAANGVGPAGKKILAELPTLTGSSTYPVNVWIDGAGMPRQLSYALTLPKAPTGTPASADSAFPETTKLTIGLSDYGTISDVSVPPAAQVSTESLSQLEAAAGGS